MGRLSPLLRRIARGCDGGSIRTLPIRVALRRWQPVYRLHDRRRCTRGRACGGPRGEVHPRARAGGAGGKRALLHQGARNERRVPLQAAYARPQGRAAHGRSRAPVRGSAGDRAARFRGRTGGRVRRAWSVRGARRVVSGVHGPAGSERSGRPYGGGAHAATAKPGAAAGRPRRCLRLLRRRAPQAVRGKAAARLRHRAHSRLWGTPGGL